MKRIDWDEYFMLLAHIVSMRSTCLKRNVGCVIVRDNRILTTGYNGATEGEPHCIDLERCMKNQINSKGSYDYCPAVHGEENAILQAARIGISLRGATCYTTVSPCYYCAKSLKNAGIRRIVYDQKYSSSDQVKAKYWWNFLVSNFELKQVSVRIDTVDRIRLFLQEVAR